MNGGPAPTPALDNPDVARDKARMAATYVPPTRTLFFYDAGLDGPPTSKLASDAETRETKIVSPVGRVWVEGRAVAIDVVVPRLLRVAAKERAALSASEQVYAHAARLAGELVARGFAAPTIVDESGRAAARHRAVLDDDDVAARVDALARAMPRAAHAAPATDEGALVVWTARAVLESFLDDAVDALVRAAAAAAPTTTAPDAPAWATRLARALTATDATVALDDDDPGTRAVVGALAPAAPAATNGTRPSSSAKGRATKTKGARAPSGKSADAANAAKAKGARR